MPRFEIDAPYALTPAQADAVEALVAGARRGKEHQVLLGVTGAGKTFTVAHVIERLQLPTLVISHNKTLAAQLYTEFKALFPRNAVEFFVSYYDYYQPEAYIPATDTYVEKNATINRKIELLRLAATSALMSRGDVIVVASVSCIYGIGSPDTYRKMTVRVRRGEEMERDLFLRRLVAVYYERNDVDVSHGKFRVRGDVVEVFPGYDDRVVRVEFFGDSVDRLSLVDPLTGDVIEEREEVFVFPATHFVAEEDAIEDAAGSILHELQERCRELRAENLLLEEQRLRARTLYDVEMLREMGYCPGIENYSRHINRRLPGEKPYTLLDYFPADFLCIIDESHVTIPQIAGMYRGDRARKETLVAHGFRLPSALDNRPLTFEEFNTYLRRAVYVSATPGEYETGLAGRPVELVVRPTGLLDPVIEVRPTRGQVEDLLREVEARAARGERVLVTTLTKRMAEELSGYITEAGMRCTYIHAEIDTIRRVEILKTLREGEIDVLVGVNLLREGLDLPEVSLVAVMDADKEGFLRSATSLIQTIGRTARNVNAAVILYADTVTDSMKRAIGETERRRRMQAAYNARHGITPATVSKPPMKTLEEILRAERLVRDVCAEEEEEYILRESVRELEERMLRAAEELRFEEAARLRDGIERLKNRSRHGKERGSAGFR